MKRRWAQTPRNANTNTLLHHRRLIEESCSEVTSSSVGPPSIIMSPSPSTELGDLEFWDLDIHPQYTNNNSGVINNNNRTLGGGGGNNVINMNLINNLTNSLNTTNNNIPLLTTIKSDNDSISGNFLTNYYFPFRD